MNDEPSSSTAHGHLEDGPDKPEAAAAAAELAERRKKNRQMFNRKRGDLLDDLLRNLDILVYAELSAIYYMEYVTFRVPLLDVHDADMFTAAPSCGSSSGPLYNSCSCPRNLLYSQNTLRTSLSSAHFSAATSFACSSISSSLHHLQAKQREVISTVDWQWISSDRKDPQAKHIYFC